MNAGKQNLALLALGLSALMLGGTALGADCQWVAATGDWDEPTNWSDCADGVPGPADTVGITAGQISLTGDRTIAGLTMSGGAIHAPAAANHSLTITDNLLLSGGAKQFSGLTIHNQGAALWSGGTLSLRPNLPFAVFRNETGAVFTLDGALAFTSGFSGTNQARIINEGTLVKIGTGLANLSASGPRLRNNGLIEVQQGQLRIIGNGSAVEPHDGAFTVAASATLELDSGPGPHHFAAASSITGAGNVRFFQNGPWTLSPGMTYGIQGTTRIDQPTSCPCNLFMHTDAQTGSLAMVASSGTSILSNDGSLTVSGSFNWNAGSIGGSATGQFTLDVLDGISINTSFSAVNLNGIVQNRGEAIYSGGTFYLRHPSARFINHPGASFEIQGGRVISYRLGGSDPVHGVFDNQGALIKTGPGEAIIEGIVIENSGLLDVQEGSLRFTRHSSQSQPWRGARLVLNDGVVQSQSPLVFEESRLYGRGVVNADVEINNAIFLGSGTSPTGSDLEAGILQINGDLTLTDTSALYVRLISADPQPGVGFTQLQLSNLTELRGDLVIHIRDTFVDDIQIGDEFVAITCAQGCTGTFERVSVSVPAEPGLVFKTDYQGTQVVLRAFPDSIFADRFSF